MKTFFLAGLLLCAGCATYAQNRYPQPGPVEVRAVNDFYAPLSEHGYWVQVEPYGWCWQPASVTRNWQPYGDGFWVWTDGGWYWESDEPWAWACYHYGRWVCLEDRGWLWVPDTMWAPAWVSFRESPTYVGWAPLPPGCGFDPNSGYVEMERVVIPPTAYIFVEHRHFCEPISRVVIIRERTVFRDTANCRPVRRTERGVCNEGPAIEHFERVGERRIPTASLRELRERERKPSSAVIAGTPPSPAVSREHSNRRDGGVPAPAVHRVTATKAEPAAPPTRPTRTPYASRSITRSDDSRNTPPPVRVSHRKQETPPPAAAPAPEVRTNERPSRPTNPYLGDRHQSEDYGKSRDR